MSDSPATCGASPPSLAGSAWLLILVTGRCSMSKVALHGPRPTTRSLATSPRVEPPQTAVMDFVAGHARTVLSVACGAGPATGGVTEPVSVSNMAWVVVGPPKLNTTTW